MMDHWTVEEFEYLPDRLKARETLFYQANGYLGIRAYPEEGLQGSRKIPARLESPSDGLMHQYVAMVFDHSPVTGNTMVNLPTARLCWIDLNGEELNLKTGKVSDFVQRLKMKDSRMERRFTWCSPQGRKTELCFESFLSWEQQHALCTRIHITPQNWSGPVCITQVTDHTGGTLGQHHLQQHACTELATGFAVEVKTHTSDIGIVVARGFGTSCTLGHMTRRKNGAQQTGTFTATEGSCLVIDQYAIVTTSADHGDSEVPLERARSILASCRRVGYETLASEQRQSWKTRWEQCDLKVETSEPNLQQRIRFHIYQLMQAYRAGNSDLSIGAKFLSGQHYAGHYFWDTEIFLLPFYLYTQPEAAKNLLEHRVNRLDGARAKAKNMGYAGAFYPWEADPLSGHENCPAWWQDASSEEPVRVWCGEIELHINAAILYGLDQYRKVTGDEAFWFGAAAPVVLECARFMASRGSWIDGAFELHDVIGPDEYHEHVNNDAYTNWTCGWTMRMALKLLAEASDDRREALIAELNISEEERANWARIAKHVKLTIHPELGILEQDDTYTTLPVIPEDKINRSDRQYSLYKPGELTKLHMIKQASVLALHHLFPTAFKADLMQRDWDYYKPRTVHDSSLSCGSHAILAARLGKVSQSIRFFNQVLDEDMSPQCGHPGDGFHAANAGNAWLVPATGYAGLSATRDALHISPNLPNGWNHIQLRIFYRFRALEISITPNSISINSEAGPACTLVIEGEPYTLSSTAQQIVHKRN